jgi:TetR/AcrR family transcriptional regulator
MQDRAKKTQEKILKTARTIFAKKGFYGSRVDEIADKAGVNKQRIYAYFRNKEGLYAEVLKIAFSLVLLEEDIFKDFKEEDIQTLPEVLLRHYFDFHEKYPFFWRLVAWENLEGGQHIQTLKGLRDESYQRIRQLYKKGQAKGYFRKKFSFESFIFAITSFSYFFYSNQRTMSQTLDKDLFDKDVRQNLLKELTELVLISK